MNNRIVEKNTPEFISPCSACRHKFKSSKGCSAFPSEIPMEILLGKNLHLTPLSIQENDIVFEKEV